MTEQIIKKNISKDNNTLHTTPKWLNKEFFLKVLENYENATNLELINLKLNPATGVCDHYASILFRAEIDYKFENALKKLSMFIKAVVEEEGEHRDLLKESKIFETEIEIYSKVIPKFEAILKAIGDETKFGPRCLYYALEPHKVIVFEDLTNRGYVGLNDRGTNFEETKAIHSKIAKWHALSYKINAEEPAFLKPFIHDTISFMKVEENPAFNDGTKNFIDLLNSEPDLKKFVPYFATQIGKMTSYWINSTLEYLENRQPMGLYVLRHGDFHHRNIMFKNQAQNQYIEDILFIDYQMCSMGSMATDLIHSIYMIMDGEQRMKNVDELFYFYFEIFKQTLIKTDFNGKIPKMLDFCKERMRFKDVELFFLITFSPMIIAVDKGNCNIHELMTNAVTRKNMYKDPDYIEQVRHLLPKYLYLGYLEQ